MSLLRNRLSKVESSFAPPIVYTDKWVSGYVQREPFIPFHNRTARWAVIVSHRRSGKTFACINEIVHHCLADTSKMGRYAYMAPYYNQAKAVAWDYSKRFCRDIKGIKINESELRIDFANGSRLQLFGADNAERLRGLYFNGIVCDEFANYRPSIWEYILRPALADRLGWCVFIGTPKGKNSFYDKYQEAINGDDNWFALKVSADESGLLPDSEIEALKAEMSAMAYRQEMLCDFEIPIQGAYYADALEDAKRDGRIGHVAIDPLMTIRSFWDIGGTGARADSCAIWIAQFVGKEIRVIDYYEAQGQPLATHVMWLRDNGYGKAQCVLPHDGVQHDKVYTVTYESALQEAGFDTYVVKNQGPGAAAQRIEALRRLFPAIWFNDNMGTKDGLNTLAMYHENRDDVRNIGLGPMHDSASHCGDAIGLMAVAQPLLINTKWAKIEYNNSGIV